MNHRTSKFSLILFLFLITCLSPADSLAELYTDGIQCKSKNGKEALTYSNGSIDTVLTQCYSESSVQDFVFLPSKKYILFATSFPEPSRLIVYNLEKNYGYDVSPHPWDSRYFTDFEEAPSYFDFDLDPSGRFISVKNIENPSIVPSPTDFTIYKLEDLEAFIKSVNTAGLHNIVENLSLNPWLIGNIFDLTGQVQDSHYSLLGKISDSEINSLYDFNWQAAGQYQVKGLDNKKVSTPSYDQKENNFVTRSIFEGEAQTELITKTGYYPPSPFSDLNEDDPDYAEILRAMQAGWLQGYPDGTLKLDQPINRAEFSKVVIQALGIPQTEPVVGSNVCPDAPAGEWYSAALHTAKQKGAIQGYPQDGVPKEQWLCKPGQTINKVEALKVVLELAGFHLGLLLPEDYSNQFADTQDASTWFAPYTAYAKIEILFRPLSDGRLAPGEPMTRREMIYLANHTLDVFGKWGGLVRINLNDVSTV